MSFEKEAQDNSEMAFYHFGLQFIMSDKLLNAHCVLE